MLQVPVEWESVSVAPVRTPDGHVTVPEEVIHSMQRNKIGLKGKCERKGRAVDEHMFRSTGDASG